MSLQQHLADWTSLTGVCKISAWINIPTIVFYKWYMPMQHTRVWCKFDSWIILTLFVIIICLTFNSNQAIEELQDGKGPNCVDVSTEAKKLPTYISINKTSGTQDSCTDKWQGSRTSGEAKSKSVIGQFKSIM